MIGDRKSIPVAWALKVIMREAGARQRDYATMNFLLQEASYKGIVGKGVETAAKALERHLISPARKQRRASGEEHCLPCPHKQVLQVLNITEAAVPPCI